MREKMKMNMIFDATLLLHYFDSKTNSRSGIFFVQLNLLKQFALKPNLNIFLYSSYSKSYKKWKNLQKELIDDIGETSVSLVPFGKKEELQSSIDFFDSKRVIAKKKKKVIDEALLQIKITFCELLKRLSKAPNFDDFYESINVYFSPMFKVPDFIENKYQNIKQYVILYDIIPRLFPDEFLDYDEDFWLAKLIKSMTSDKKYFAISKATKKDFLKFVPQLEENNVIVSPLAAAKTFYPCLDRRKDIVERYHLPSDKKYILSLCSLAPHKNLIRTVQTFIQFIKKNNIDDLVFVLGGGYYPDFIKQLNRVIDDLGDFQDKILKIGYVADEDLAPLYSQAQWFVYTSRYEGFGLPPLEAMSCGCPVITSNNSSLPEVVGDAGIMIDFDSDEQHIEAYEKYYFDNEYRKEMAQKGLEHSKQFSWEKCANIIINEINK